MWPAVIGASAALVIAFLARLPSLTSAGRRQAALKRDLELLALMPAGQPRDNFASVIDAAINTHVLLRKTAPQLPWTRSLWLVLGSAGIVVGSILAVLGSRVDNPWTSSPLVVVGSALATFGAMSVSWVARRRLLERRLRTGLEWPDPSPTTRGAGVPDHTGSV